MTVARNILCTAVVALMATTGGIAHAQEGRLSLAERVARLEQQASQPAPASGGNMELLNRIQELQSEVQSLRNLIEQQTFEIEDLKNRQRMQYIDLDSRIEQLGGGGEDGDRELDLGGDTDDSSAAANVPPPAVPAPPVDRDQLLIEDAVPVDPYTGEPIGGNDQAVAPDAGSDASSGDATAPSSSVAMGGDADAEYQAAFDALKQGRYADSTRLFNNFVRDQSDHELADNAMYWLGESYYVTQNYETALTTFRDLVERYPDGEKAADAELKIGYCLYELGQRNQARDALEAVIQRYPDTTVSRLAQSRLRALSLDQL